MTECKGGCGAQVAIGGAYCWNCHPSRSAREGEVEQDRQARARAHRASVEREMRKAERQRCG